MWKGPKNAPVSMGLSELKGILNKFKDIENKQDKIYPKCKNSKA